MELPLARVVSLDDGAALDTRQPGRQILGAEEGRPAYLELAEPGVARPVRQAEREGAYGKSRWLTNWWTVCPVAVAPFGELRWRT